MATNNNMTSEIDAIIDGGSSLYHELQRFKKMDEILAGYVQN